MNAFFSAGIAHVPQTQPFFDFALQKNGVSKLSPEYTTG